MKSRTLPPWSWSLFTLLAILAFNAFFLPGFFSLELKEGHLFGSLIDIVNRAVPVALISLGMSMVIATRGVDLSVGAVLAIAGTIAAKLVVSAHLTLGLTVLIALAGGLVLGLCNGIMVSLLGIQPIVATLVLMVSGRGVAQLISDGQIITFSDPGLSFLGSGYLFGLPFGIWIALLALLLVWGLVRTTALGTFVEAVGDNPVASRFTGIPVKSILLLIYALTGVLAAVAGLIIAGQNKAADPNNAGLYIELDAILAVVLGGTALTGGRFYLFGSMIGALLIQTLTTTILTKGIQAEWMLVVKAVIVLFVCLLQAPALRKLFTRRSMA